MGSDPFLQATALVTVRRERKGSCCLSSLIWSKCLQYTSLVREANEGQLVLLPPPSHAGNGNAGRNAGQVRYCGPH